MKYNRRRKGEYLNRTDHRLDLTTAGGRLFVLKDRQAEARSARRIQVWMRVVLALAAVGITAVVLLFSASYLVPWFRAELQLDTPAASSALSSGNFPTEEPAAYDDLGLPVYGDDVTLFVINSASPAPEDFFVNTGVIGGVPVDRRIGAALQSLINAAGEEGLSLGFTQGYTSYEEQKQRFDAVVETLEETEGLTAVMARAEAAAIEPQPGQSDFQTGLCVRISGDPGSFSESAVYAWLKANMGKYGFIFRYPEDREDSTGVECDWTVIRYVGAANATAMQQRSLCLEEYIAYLDEQ